MTGETQGTHEVGRTYGICDDMSSVPGSVGTLGIAGTDGKPLFRCNCSFVHPAALNSQKGQREREREVAYGGKVAAPRR